MPRHDADLYDYLATSKVSEVTITQLEQALENSFINKSNIEFWKGPITVHRLLEVSRTYPWGLPVPEAGTVEQFNIEAGGITLIQPTGTELWEIAAMEGWGQPGNADLKFSYTDGAYEVEWHLATVTASGTKIDMNSLTPTQIRINNSLYFRIEETSGLNAATLFVAYHKRSL